MKKKLVYRTLAILLSMGMVSSSLVGCGSNSTKEIEQTAEIEEAADESSEEASSVDLEEAKKVEEEAKKAEEEAKKAEEEAKKAEEDAKKAQEEAKTEEERLKAEAEAKKAEEERLKAEAEAKKAEEERLKAEAEAKKAEEDLKKAEEEKKQKAEEEEKKKAEEVAAQQKAEEERKIKNSYSMLYHLAITAENIRTSKDNRLMLDDIYTSLLNDINPGSIDETTQNHIQNLCDVIKSYINISTKRERLQFIHNQKKAAAMRNAVPNPIAVLSMANSLDWKRLAISAVYTVVDSYTNYKNESENADTEFLMSGWNLDDEERNAVQNNRERAFNYMVDMVQEYDLDGLKTLSEEDIKSFSEICATEAPAEKIKLLRAEERKYELLGNYWLELADCYFELDKYADCLECVEKYNDLSIGIYKKDTDYVQILPKAIVSAQNIYKGAKYESEISKYANAIIDNTSSKDWSTRYFAAQVYLDLYSKTNKKEYFDKAYEYIYDNVTVLLKEQRNLNTSYLALVQEVKISEPDYRYMTEQEKKDAQKEFKAEEKRVKAYNEGLKKARKTELPSLYEPLILNCELLFALSEKMNISKGDMNDINSILQAGNNGTFIIEPINDFYSFNDGAKNYEISMTKDDITIPVALLSAESKVEITITDKGNKTTISDCTISNVERKGDNIKDFKAVVSSKQWKKISWTADSHVSVKIIYSDAYNRELILNYKVNEYESHWYGDKVVFEKE
ncbi:hypothetical protein NXH67_03310 [Butyrivibrio sp. DSM 10294]|uniref:hypothetical protein n=1 Tax=Butyrivibrio sp. DSM 10294 TaxID=2972457 RepID=UPI00234EB625|nr:hypothetical protein [Butyrivibrio sp. DSM 10294]MDC7292542.1 hypothetical protein [Butyrivibrio sp. DSM 10294]